MNKTKIFIISILVGIIIVGVYREKINKQTSDTNAMGKEGEEIKLLNNPAPDFKLTDLQDKEYTKENLKGKKVILFFNEGLACYPACWNEMIALGKDERINKDDTVVLSVVTDSKESWRNAMTKSVDLRSVKLGIDENAVTSKVFGMLNQKSSMHAGTPGHTYVILDKEGIVRYVLDDPRMGNNTGAIFAKLAEIN